MDFLGRRVTIMGLGHFGGGVGAARWLAQEGARVTVTDLADDRALACSLDALADAFIAGFHLGGHREEDFRNTDLLVVNPAVRPDNPFLRIARESGVKVTSEIGLFMERCPAPIVGVTGSNGKSTTAAMTSQILQRAGFRTWLGGNIGESLLGRLGEIAPDDRVVLEL
ncbi:MAG: UDP-N-acetylmuramoyl-L-alanine--D-glutamate ligase, partial [Actinomycetia bacterium]|nr:UDP-N-acetylmuramoyl-L-alanine--D-glutamate ligase [Actinomycetes bacterium]